MPRERHRFGLKIRLAALGALMLLLPGAAALAGNQGGGVQKAGELVLQLDSDNSQFVLFDNDGNTMSRRPQELSAQTAASCAILHDRDNDGDLDVTGIDEIDDLIFLFRNGS